MTHNQALTALAAAVDGLDRDKMQEPHHVARTDGGDGYMIITRDLYVKMVRKIHALQRQNEDSLPSDEEAMDILVGERGTIH